MVYLSTSSSNTDCTIIILLLLLSIRKLLFNNGPFDYTVPTITGSADRKTTKAKIKIRRRYGRHVLITRTIQDGGP